MSKRQVINVAESVKARLLNLSRSRGVDFNQLLQLYAMERFLYRLGRSQHADRFVLKGALMLQTLCDDLWRPTMDIDLLGSIQNDHAVLERVILDCCRIEGNDGMVYDATEVALENITEAADYHGVRIRFLGYLGTARVRMQIDVGFGDVVTPDAATQDLPEILDFGPPRLQIYPAESAISEKLHALVTRETINSRMKDFYDIRQMASHLRFDGATLAAAISATFSNRSTAVPKGPPLGLTPAFAEAPGKEQQWHAFLRKAGRTEEASMVDAIAEIAEFLLPALDALSHNRLFSKNWQPGGPWT